MNMLELQSLKSLTWVCFCYCPPQYPVSPTPPPAIPNFYMGKLRRSNYYLTNLFKSKVGGYVSPGKMAGCVFKFWILQLNSAQVHCFLHASKMEHYAFDGCFWSLIKTLKVKRARTGANYIHSQYTQHNQNGDISYIGHVFLPGCLSNAQYEFFWVADVSK